MPEFRMIDVGELRLRCAIEGSGPLVILVHGFPESWYSWRHQLGPIAAAGFTACAIDVRGYGGSDKPHEVAAYTLQKIDADLAGLADALQPDAPAILIGHDWGAPIVWNAALTNPARFRAVAGLSVPFAGVPQRPFTEIFREHFTSKGRFFYQEYFQEPGVAEAELDVDLRRTLGSVLYALSGDIPRDEYRFFDPSARSLFDVVNDLPGPLDWLSDADLDAFVESFSHHGTFFGGINWYRNIDRNRELLAPFVGVQVRQPALFIGAEFDSIFGQTEEAVLATRAAVPNLRDPIWVAGSGHWIQQEEPEIVNAALLEFLRSLPD